MATLTTTYLDKKLAEQDAKLQERFESTTSAILGVMKQSFDEQSRRMDRIEAALASLTVSVDRLVKIITDQGQEIVVLRKQLKEIEERVKQLEMEAKSS